MRISQFAIALLLATFFNASLLSAREAVVVTVPSEPGPVDGKTENSDAFIWRLFTEFSAPAPDAPKRVVFQTWASDADTFSKTPHWPSPSEPIKFQASFLASAKRMPADQLKTLLAAHQTTIDVPCKTPGNAGVGGFPSTGSPKPCIAEQVNRNRPQYDYIVQNGLNTKDGLAKAFAKNFDVDMPLAAVSVKGDWVPLATMLRWIPRLGSFDNIRKLYYTTTVDSPSTGPVDYALVALHVSSRQNKNWVWGTFEHQMNPGRCDSIGCFDTFGAVKPAVLPNKAEANTQYGACAKSARLEHLMKGARLASVWDNYCLKATEVDYEAPDGTPYALGNSVIEGITGGGTIAASSCIACHVYASFGSNGAPTAAAVAMLPFNPTGKPLSSVLAGSRKFDFMWGVIGAP